MKNKKINYKAASKALMKNFKPLITHQQDEKTGIRFTLAAIPVNEHLLFGYSICSNKDQFDRAFGRTSAILCAHKNPYAVLPTATDINGNIKKLVELAEEFKIDGLRTIVTIKKK